MHRFSTLVEIQFWQIPIPSEEQYWNNKHLILKITPIMLPRKILSYLPLQLNFYSIYSLPRIKFQCIISFQISNFISHFKVLFKIDKKHTYNTSSNELLKSTIVYNTTHAIMHTNIVNKNIHQFMQFNILTRYRSRDQLNKSKLKIRGSCI